MGKRLSSLDCQDRAAHCRLLARESLNVESQFEPIADRWEALACRIEIWESINRVDARSKSRLP